MQKYNLTTQIQITPVKAFEFISGQDIPVFESLGFHVITDDESNDTHYAHAITDCQVALEGLMHDLRAEGLEPAFERNGQFLSFSEMEAMTLEAMA
jgi:hypothetical protein